MVAPNRYSQIPAFLRDPDGYLPDDKETGPDPDEMDDYLNEGYTSAAAPMMVPPVAPEAAAPKPQRSESSLRATADYNTLRTQLATQPTMSSPKWWQRLGGAAAGFGAGWSNAAGRTRHPIDIAGMQENILHPGYQGKLAEWQSRVGPLEQIATLDRAQSDQERRDRQMDISEEWNSARAQAEKQRGLMWAARAQAYGQGKATKTTSPINVPPGGSLVDPVSGKVLYHNDKPVTQSASGVHTLAPGAILVGPDGKEIAHNPKPLKEVDPITEELREQRLQENKYKSDERVENTKAAAENRLRAQRRAEVAALMKGSNATEDDLWKLPDQAAKLQAINQRYAPLFQGVQDNYERGVRMRGGSADHYVVDPRTLGYNQPPVVPPPAAAPPSASPAATVTKTLRDGTTFSGSPEQFDALFKKRPDLKPR